MDAHLARLRTVRATAAASDPVKLTPPLLPVRAGMIIADGFDGTAGGGGGMEGGEEMERDMEEEEMKNRGRGGDRAGFCKLSSFFISCVGLLAVVALEAV